MDNTLLPLKSQADLVAILKAIEHALDFGNGDTVIYADCKDFPEKSFIKFNLIHQPYPYIFTSSL